jgi:hypothetical protein
MLKDKKAKDQLLPSEEAIRKKIFQIHNCKDARCGNKMGCCYELRSTKTHHKIFLPQQEEWARCVVGNLRGATLDDPPIDWITSFGTGWQDTGLKRSGNKKIEAPPPELKDRPIQVTVNNPAPAPPPSYPVPRYHPPQYYNAQYSNDFYECRPPAFGYPPQMQPPRQWTAPEPIAAPTPSSPIRASDGEELLNRYEQWLLGRERSPGRQEAFRQAFIIAR